MMGRWSDPRGRARWVVAAVAAAAVLGSVDAVWAQPATPSLPPSSATAEDAARAAFVRGLEALQARRFGEAVLNFEEAVRQRPTPLTQYNLGLAYRGTGRYREAIETFGRYLAEPEPGVLPERLAAIRAAIDQMRQSLVRLSITVTPTEATLRVDGRPVAIEAGIAMLDPGTHVLELSAPGHQPDSREMSLPPGGQAVLSVNLRPVPVDLVPAAEVGRLAVSVTPENAIVELDGQRIGTGSIVREVPEGPHLVGVRASGFVTVRREVRVTPGGLARVDVTLSPVRRTGWVLPVVLGAVGVAVVAVGAVIIANEASGEVIPAAPGNWGANLTEGVRE